MKPPKIHLPEKTNVEKTTLFKLMLSMINCTLSLMAFINTPPTTKALVFVLKSKVYNLKYMCIFWLMMHKV